MKRISNDLWAFVLPIVNVWSTAFSGKVLPGLLVLLATGAALPCRASSIDYVQNQWYNGASGSGVNIGNVQQASAPLSNSVSLSGIYAGCSYAASSFSMAASYGSLSVSGSGEADPLPCAGSNAFFDNANWGGPPPAYWDMTNGAMFVDTLTVTSSTLNPGDPVQLLLTSDFTGGALSSSTFVDGYGNPYAHASIFDSLQINGTLPGDSNLSQNISSSGTISLTLTTHVGDVLTFAGWITPEGDAGSGPSYGINTYSFSGTANDCVDVLTPGAGYSASSGTSYCSAQSTSSPEPDSMWLLGGGLVLTARRFLRHRG